MAGTQRRPARLAEPGEDGVQDLQVTDTEAQELEAAGEYTAVPVGDMEARVKPQVDWRMSDIRALNKGDLDAWAESVIHPDDLEDFLDLDITMAEFQVFADEAAALTGDGLGKSKRRSGSSRSTRRR